MRADCESTAVVAAARLSPACAFCSPTPPSVRVSNDVYWTSAYRRCLILFAQLDNRLSLSSSHSSFLTPARSSSFHPTHEYVHPRARHRIYFSLAVPLLSVAIVCFSQGEERAECLASGRNSASNLMVNLAQSVRWD